MYYLLILFSLPVFLPVVTLSDATEEESDDTATATDTVTVADVPVPDSYISGIKSYLKWTPDDLYAHHESSQSQDHLLYQQSPHQQDPVQERSLSLEPGLGWAVGTAILIFAFANTVIVGSTLVVTYTIYQILVSVLAVVAPSVATMFVSLLGPLG